MGRRKLPVPRSRPDSHGGEARGQGFVGALPPWNDAPGLFGEPHRQLPGRNRRMFAVAAHARWRAPPSAPGFGRQRFGAGGPDAQCRLHADHIGQTVAHDAGTESAVSAITGIGQQDDGCDAGGKRRPDLIERDLWFCRVEPTFLGASRPESLAANFRFQSCCLRRVEIVALSLDAWSATVAIAAGRETNRRREIR